MELLLSLYPKWIEKRYPFDAKELRILNGLYGTHGGKEGGIYLSNSKTKGGFFSECAERLSHLEGILPTHLSFRSFVRGVMADDPGHNLDIIPAFKYHYLENMADWETMKDEDTGKLRHNKDEIMKGFVAVGKQSRSRSNNALGEHKKKSPPKGGGGGGGGKAKNDAAKVEAALAQVKKDDLSKFKNGYLKELMELPKFFSKAESGEIFKELLHDGEIIVTLKLNKDRLIQLFESNALPPLIKAGFLKYRIALEEKTKLYKCPDWKPEEPKKKRAAKPERKGHTEYDSSTRTPPNKIDIAFIQTSEDDSVSEVPTTEENLFFGSGPPQAVS